MTRLTRRYEFAASHRLALPGLSLDENLAKFGKCANPFGHGHNYRVEVSVRGAIIPSTGRVVNPSKLDEYVQTKVVSYFDHKDMNHDLPDFAGKVPTTENLAHVISARLQDGWPFESIRLDGIRIQETKRNFFELKEL